jgi:hypothetical protein
MLIIAISIGLVGCKKSPPAQPKPAKPPVEQKKPAMEQAAPAIQQTAADAQKALQETTQKAPETALPAVEPAKQALTTAAAEIDLTSSLDTLKEKAKQMSIDALKATAEKYKAQILSTQGDLSTKTDLLSKIPAMDKLGPEAQALTKDIQNLTSSLTALKDRLMIYVDILKAKGVDISSFKL